MSGQDATISIEQAKKQMARTESHGGSAHQGPKSSGKCAGTTHPCEKVEHQGK